MPSAPRAGSEDAARFLSAPRELRPGLWPADAWEASSLAHHLLCGLRTVREAEMLLAALDDLPNDLAHASDCRDMIQRALPRRLLHLGARRPDVDRLAASFAKRGA